MRGLLTGLAACCVYATTFCLLGTARGADLATASPPSAKITFDLDKGHAVTETLWGIFFEEIQHAGDGGLYAELIQDRQFGGLAYSLGLFHTDAVQIEVPLTYYLNDYLPLSSAVVQRTPSAPEANLTGIRRWRQEHTLPEYSLKGQPKSWFPVGGAELTLVKQQPITFGQPSSTAYIKVSTGSKGGGLSNSGYWGVPVQDKQEYQLSVILQSESADLANQAPQITVQLESQDRQTVYASAAIEDISASLRHLKLMLASNGTDPNAQLTLFVHGKADLAIRMLSLFPAENVKGEVLQPFRTDILQYLKDLKPRYVRMPGGCYVEGVSLDDAYWWKPSAGPIQDRPGHYNGPWHYWSTDGMGAFEYFQLAEALDAEPLWVINNGISHTYSVPAEQIWPLVQDALDLIEFVSGPVESEWGSLRAKMGHPKPWQLNYFAIGNEDCGKPWYVENYIAFFAAIRARYPHMRLISNCDMDPHAPTDLWDWHMYTDSQNMFDRRHDFDNVPNIKDTQIFASEYAVFDDPAGRPIEFPGNLKAAIAEAGFMTGMERNSLQVAMAAFAPLLSHWNDRACPHNMIIFNNHQVFGTTSYYVQKLFSEFQGVRYIETTVSTPEHDPRDHGIAASATCQDEGCTQLAFKIVNFASEAQQVDVEVLGLHSSPDMMTVHLLNSTDGQAENSFAEPYMVVPHRQEVRFNGPASSVSLPPFSLTVTTLDLSRQPSMSISQA
uniref:non-reducing end alpha-L-arabinofuranosidase n=1 Tax=Trebouxia lynnae TaxID=1825957 RepID=A0A7L9QED4_9CHLO|nr:putative extracellular protein TR9_006 [Trebouxia lynnae]